jgi:hypothetical protein
MKLSLAVRLFGIACIASAGAGWTQPPLAAHEEFVCTSGQDKRLVSLYSRPASKGNREAGACRVDYTRAGKTTTLWSSTTDNAYCTSKALSLVTKLVQGNYACKPEAVGQADGGENADGADKPGTTGP